MYELDGSGLGSCSFKDQTPHLFAQSTWKYILKIAQTSELTPLKISDLRRPGKKICAYLPDILLELFTIKDRTESFSQNVCTELPLYTM